MLQYGYPQATGRIVHRARLKHMVLWLRLKHVLPERLRRVLGELLTCNQSEPTGSGLPCLTHVDVWALWATEVVDGTTSPILVSSPVPIYFRDVFSENPKGPCHLKQQTFLVEARTQKLIAN